MTEETTGGQNDTVPAGGEAQTEGAAETGTLLTGQVEGQPEAEATAEQGESSESQAEGDQETEGDAPQVPETYEFKMPDGMEMDAGLAEAAGPVFKELGLTQEQADQVTDMYAKAMEQQVQEAEDAFNKQLDSWKQDLMKDQDFGGDNFDENAGKVFEFINETVPADIKDDLMGMLGSTGVGNHPALVKYMFHLSNAFPVGEDQPGSGSPVSGPRDLASNMYAPDGGVKKVS